MMAKKGKKIVATTKIVEGMKVSSVYKILELRVERGIKFLDKTLGRKVWVDKIDLNLLKLSNADVCVCGQAFTGHWDFAVEKHFGSDTNKAAYCGFNFHDEDEEQWDMLQHVWYCAIFSIKKKQDGNQTVR